MADRSNDHPQDPAHLSLGGIISSSTESRARALRKSRLSDFPEDMTVTEAGIDPLPHRWGPGGAFRKLAIM